MSVLCCSYNAGVLLGADLEADRRCLPKVLTEGAYAYAYAECVLLFAVSAATRLRMSGR